FVNTSDGSGYNEGDLVTLVGQRLGYSGTPATAIYNGGPFTLLTYGSGYQAGDSIIMHDLTNSSAAGRNYTVTAVTNYNIGGSGTGFALGDSLKLVDNISHAV